MQIYFTRLLLILFLGLPLLANADIFQWRDSNGDIHYSDKAVAEATLVQVKAGHSFYKVKTIYDGDTVVLEDGQKVRLLGINTPEVAHRGQGGDAGGEAAKRWLQEKLANTKVRLELDAEKTDKYGRTLAHLLTEDKGHINLQLVAAGLASVTIHPPNLLYVDELVAAEERAQAASLGIWQLPEYAPIKVSDLADAKSGWVRVVGRPKAIRQSRKFVYVEFSEAFDIRIERQSQQLFPELSDYQGKMLEVRGWLNRSKGHVSMLVRHPSAIKRY